jgi:hypothetical protein
MTWHDVLVVAIVAALLYPAVWVTSGRRRWNNRHAVQRRRDADFVRRQRIADRRQSSPEWPHWSPFRRWG